MYSRTCVCVLRLLYSSLDSFFYSPRECGLFRLVQAFRRRGQEPVGGGGGFAVQECWEFWLVCRYLGCKGVGAHSFVVLAQS